MFKSLRAILHLHQNLLKVVPWLRSTLFTSSKEMEARINNWSPVQGLGDVFVNLVSGFKMLFLR